LEIDPTIAQLMLQGKATAYERQLSAGNIGQLSPSSQPVLEASIVAAPDYGQSDRWMAYQNAITKAAQARDADRVIALANAEKQAIGQGDFDMAGLALVDREVLRAMDMINADPEPEVLPDWVGIVAAKRDELRLSKEDVKALASSAKPPIALKKGLSDKDLNRLLAIMEEAAEIVRSEAAA
jgi:hypothetical protein